MSSYLKGFWWARRKSMNLALKSWVCILANKDQTKGIPNAQNSTDSPSSHFIRKKNFSIKIYRETTLWLNGILKGYFVWEGRGIWQAMIMNMVYIITCIRVWGKGKRSSYCFAMAYQGLTRSKGPFGEVRSIMNSCDVKAWGVVFCFHIWMSYTNYIHRINRSLLQAGDGMESGWRLEGWLNGELGWGNELRCRFETID